MSSQSHLRGDRDNMGQTGLTRTMRRIALLKSELVIVETVEESAMQATQNRFQRLIEWLAVHNLPDGCECESDGE
jgi:hypothetical protein